MELKEAQTGTERLAYYLGVPSGPWAKLFLLAFILLGLALAKFLPLLDAVLPGGAPVTQIFLELVWFAFMVFGLLGRRQRYREKYGEKAYQKIALRFFTPAASLMFAGILRAIWVEGEKFPEIPFWLRVVLGGYFLLMGLLLEYRGVKSLGIDRITFVYTVFPERGTAVTSKLYEFLRHPLYSAMAHIALGISLIAGTIAGFLCWMIFAAKLFCWSKIEEKELIERFGESYAEYRKKVPAFVPRLSSFKSLCRFLIRG